MATCVISLARDESRLFPVFRLNPLQIDFAEFLACLVIDCFYTKLDVKIMCSEVPPKRWKSEFEYLFAIFNSLAQLLEKHSRIFDVKIELKLRAFLHVHRLIARRTVVVVLFSDVKLLWNFSWKQTFLSNLHRERQGHTLPPQQIFSKHFGSPSLSVNSPP